MPLQRIVHPSVQQIQSVRTIIDKEHASLLRIDRDAEEGAVPIGPRWRGAGVEHLDRDLFSGGRGLDQVAIPAVHCQDIAVWGDRQTQGDVQRPIDGDGRALAPGRAMLRRGSWPVTSGEVNCVAWPHDIDTGPNAYRRQTR